MAVTRRDVAMWMEQSMLGSGLDAALRRAGFTRMPNVLAYERQPADLRQRMKLVFDIGPRYEPDAIAHLLPQVVFESEALGSIILRMVPQGPLHDPGTAD